MISRIPGGVTPFSSISRTCTSTSTLRLPTSMSVADGYKPPNKKLNGEHLLLALQKEVLNCLLSEVPEKPLRSSREIVRIEIT